MNDIRFASTEAGLILLQATIRVVRRGWRMSPAVTGRIHYTSLGTSQSKDLVLQSGFLRLVSITEAAVDSLGVELTDKSVQRVDEVVARLMLEKELVATSDWRARRRLFKRHHQVDLKKCDEYDKLEGAIEVRNAIAHRLGKLTRRQLESADAPRNLARIDVATIDGAIRLEPRHLSACASYAAAFLRSADSSAS